MSQIEQLAWDLYCSETAGDLDARDDWRELPAPVREAYVAKVSAFPQQVFA